MSAGGASVGATDRKTEGLSHLPTKQAQEVLKLLECFAEIFKDPQGLPPIRKQEHVIHLIEGQGPVNVRPYRYPHHHKQEIERQVHKCYSQGS